MREEKGVSVSDLVAMGQTPTGVLKNTLEDAEVFELYGNKVDELLYYIDEGTPVFALTGNHTAVLLTGYNATKIFYYDPLVGVTQSVLYADAEAMFGAAGSRFIAYIR